LAGKTNKTKGHFFPSRGEHEEVPNFTSKNKGTIIVQKGEQHFKPEFFT